MQKYDRMIHDWIIMLSCYCLVFCTSWVNAAEDLTFKNKAAFSVRSLISDLGGFDRIIRWRWEVFFYRSTKMTLGPYQFDSCVFHFGAMGVLLGPARLEGKRSCKWKRKQVKINAVCLPRSHLPYFLFLLLMHTCFPVCASILLLSCQLKCLFFKTVS